MAMVPSWRLTGDWFDVCNCDIPCPCEFAQAPSRNVCEGILVWHVQEGQFGDVSLSGLNVVATGAFEGNLWEGKTKVIMGLYFDEQADDRQREALRAIFEGEAGGWPAGFASRIGEMRGMEFAPIACDIADDLTSWRAEVPGKVVAQAEALTGPTTPPGQLVQLVNPPGSEVGPGGVATWGRATADHVDAFGFSWDWAGKSSKHIPFDWSGPD